MSEESIDVAVEISKEIELRISDVAKKCGLGMDEMAREILVLGKELQCAADISMKRELAAFREKRAELEAMTRRAQECAIERGSQLIEANAKIAELQRQLDEAAKQEPVAYIYPAAFGSRASLAKNNKPADWDDDDRPWYEEPLYRHPPNLPALIEQERTEEREECAKLCEDMNPFVVINGERWNRNGDGKLFRLLDVAPNLERMHMNKLAFEGRSVEDEHNEHPMQKCAAAIRARKP